MNVRVSERSCAERKLQPPPQCGKDSSDRKLIRRLLNCVKRASQGLALEAHSVSEVPALHLMFNINN